MQDGLRPVQTAEPVRWFFVNPSVRPFAPLAERPKNAPRCISCRMRQTESAQRRIRPTLATSVLTPRYAAVNRVISCRQTDQDAASLDLDLDELKGDISEAPKNGEYNLDGTPNSLPRLSRTNSVSAYTGRPSPIAEESKSGHGQFSEDSKLLSRPRSPHQDDANHEKPIPVKFEETKYDNRTEEAW